MNFRHLIAGAFAAILIATPPAFAAQQTINIGSSANDGTGDTLRTAFGKTNANDSELYTALTTDRAVADGGTGASTAAGARTNLGAAASGAVASSGLTMATSRLLGRSTASTGAIEEITVGSGLTLSSGTLTASSGGFRGAVVTKASNQTAANYSAGVDIGFDSEDTDTDNIHDNVTNNARLTVPSGVTKIQLSCSASLGSVTANADTYLSILKAGSFAYTGVPSIIIDTSSTFPRATIASPPITVTSGDYFTCNLTPSGDNSVDVAAQQTWFAMVIIQ